MDIKLTTGITLQTSKGENLLQALKKNGIYLVSSCGGKGICGKCRVRILEGKSRIASTGKLEPRDIKAGITLACQTFPQGNIFIDIPKESKLVIGDRIALSKSGDLLELMKFLEASISPMVRQITLTLTPPTIEDNISDLERLRRSLEEKDMIGMRFAHEFVSSIAQSLRDSEWEVTLGYTVGNDIVYISPADTKEDRYGLAVDIGTTTVVVYLVNLTDGALMDTGSTYNSQMRYGDDVITRIVYATESGGLNELRDAVISDINDLSSTLLERHTINKEDVEAVVVAGNTTMTHIFWGLNPAYIREEPYVPTVNFSPRWRAETAILKANPRAPVFTLPCVASYVGGDTVAGGLASKMHRKSEIGLFMEIGTNGEIVIGNKEWLVTAACSAGPCFEGSGIRHGMRATEGAVESVNIDPVTFEPALGVIGDVKATGICGSGMIDAIAEVVLTEVDIENILRSKAAIYAGISLLLKEVGLGFDAIEKVYIAGGFGNYIDVDKAIILGMLPDIPREKFFFIGNACVTGAYLCLISKELRQEAGIIASKMTYIELSVSRGFMEEYMSALFLPHTHMRLFPTVKKLLSSKL